MISTRNGPRRRRRDRALGLKALAAPADVTDYAAVQAMVARVKDEAGAIDIYVSNAGVPTSGMGYARFLESTPEDWERFVKLNMYGLMNGCHAVLPGMLERAGAASWRSPPSRGGPGCRWGLPPTPPPRPGWWASCASWRRRPAARASR
jgi:NAD(P)-dependent dehydrogenase (short-subunit alcohol dehydrogenase family)